MLSVTCHIAPHLSVFTSRCSILLGSRGGGPDAWQCGPEPAQPDDGVTSVWPVVSVSMLRSSDGHQCHNNMCSPLTSVTSDIMISSQKAPVSGCQAPATWCDPCDGELSCLVLARQVSPGQEPLTYIFTFLSSLPRSQVLRQSETRWQDTGIHHWPVTTQHQAWQWEVNKAQHWKSGYFMEPKFLASVKQLLHLSVIIPTLVLWIVGPQNIISFKHILDKTKTSIKV